MREVAGILKPDMSETKHETSFQKWPAKTEPKTLNPVACPKAHAAAFGYLRPLQAFTSTSPSPPSEIVLYQPDILKRPGQIFLSRYATYLKQELTPHSLSPLDSRPFWQTACTTSTGHPPLCGQYSSKSLRFEVSFVDCPAFG